MLHYIYGTKLRYPNFEVQWESCYSKTEFVTINYRIYTPPNEYIEYSYLLNYFDSIILWVSSCYGQCTIFCGSSRNKGKTRKRAINFLYFEIE